MMLLRTLLVLWLAVAVPAAALAPVLDDDHCGTKAASAQPAVDVHAGHDMAGMPQAEHLQHMLHAVTVTPDAQADADDCQCGCNCAGHHCAGGASGLLAGALADGALAFGADERRAHAGPSRIASAHPLDLLRPPSLT